jgi:NAD(P)-dependent dehydrogenase (short-subunit alcohol dehydrogenase family)
MLTDVRDGNPTFMDKLRSAVPMKRLGTSDEVADAIAFLCSAESSYITGQVLSVNGGITMM